MSPSTRLVRAFCQSRYWWRCTRAPSTLFAPRAWLGLGLGLSFRVRVGVWVWVWVWVRVRAFAARRRAGGDGVAPAVELLHRLLGLRLDPRHLLVQPVAPLAPLRALIGLGLGVGVGLGLGSGSGLGLGLGLGLAAAWSGLAAASARASWQASTSISAKVSAT